MMRMILGAALAAALFPLVAHAACPIGAKCIGVVGAPEGTVTVGGVRWLKAPKPLYHFRPAVPLSRPERIEISQIVEIGDTLPRGAYNMVLGSAYFGLPQPPQGTMYFNVAERVMIVDRQTMTVLADATDQVIRGF